MKTVIKYTCDGAIAEDTLHEAASLFQSSGMEPGIRQTYTVASKRSIDEIKQWQYVWVTRKSKTTSLRGKAMVDTGCYAPVAGPKWHKDMIDDFNSIGLRYRWFDNPDEFACGPSKPLTSSGCYRYEVL